MGKRLGFKIVLAVLIVVGITCAVTYIANHCGQDKEVAREDIETVTKASDDDTEQPAELTDEERDSFAKLYKEKGAEIEASTQVTQEEVKQYMDMHEGSIQYPSTKLVCNVDGKVKTYYIDGDEILDCKVGEESPYGTIESMSELSEEDKEKVVESIIHSDKVTNRLLQEIRNGK